MPTITAPFALLAGLLSFISPCVLPLVPAYIGYLTAQATAATRTTLKTMPASPDGAAVVETAPSRWIVLTHGLFFVLGFTLIFVILGISVGALGQLRLAIIRGSDVIGWIGGIILVIMGLHVMGVIRIPILYYDTRRISAPSRELGLLGSAFMGITFSVGWSPCIGPMLGSILFLGSTTQSIGQAAILLFFYSLGLGIPFLLAALLLDRLTGPMAKLKRHMRKIEIVSGALVILIGIAVFTGTVQRLSGSLANFTEISMMLDDWVLRLAGGE